VSTALFTDHYELTMVDAARASKRADRQAVFEVFSRSLPGRRPYGVVAGTGRLIDAIAHFRFHQNELEFLSRRSIVSDDTLEWLANYRFSGNISGYREGEIYFPGSPILQVEGTFAEAVLLETLVLSVLNYDCAVASAASRMVQAAGSRMLIEMGARRAHEHAAVAAARAAYLAGFSATSNLQAGEVYDIPTRGTAAHSFTLVHDSEEEAFRAQIATMGSDTTLLIDTYDMRKGVERAIAIAGTALGAVRIDSGDLPVVVSQVRTHLDELGAKNTKIVVTNDLNEHTIAGLRGAPVDVFGVGTSVVTGSGHPAAGLVYKLVARENDDGSWLDVAKKSFHKTNPGGKKQAFRTFRNGRAHEEVLTIGAATPPEGSQELGETYVLNGISQSTLSPGETLARAREHHLTAIATLPDTAFSLSPGDPALPLLLMGGE
jgi:nicotinate phosphoribosyltransferase